MVHKLNFIIIFWVAIRYLVVQLFTVYLCISLVVLNQIEIKSNVIRWLLSIIILLFHLLIIIIIQQNTRHKTTTQIEIFGRNETKRCWSRTDVIEISFFFTLIYFPIVMMTEIKLLNFYDVNWKTFFSSLRLPKVFYWIKFFINLLLFESNSFRWR